MSEMRGIFVVKFKDMEANDTIYLNEFEVKLTDELLRLCRQYNMLEDVLLATDDIDEYWQRIAPEYMADAVPQIANYPTVSVAWAAYIGLGVAFGWDVDWATFSTVDYQFYYGEQGFDDMDEHIVRDLLNLPLDSTDARQLEEMIRRCGEAAVARIRHEQIEPQSLLAFHIFARACRVMFRIGAALELKRLGYRFEAVNLN